MKFKALIVSIALLMISVVSFADPAPLNMLKEVSTQMINSLESRKGNLNSHAIDQIVHQVLLPHVDLESMSRSVVGRNHWMQATAQQKEQFKHSFTNLVIQVYSAPLSKYNGETIEFKPMRDSASNQRVQVESIVIRKNGQRIPVSYRLIQNNGSWKVYDFSVEGISMISSYRSQFSNILEQGGMSALLQRMHSQTKH